MIKEILKKIEVCDICGKPDAYYKCLGCGRDFCYDHYKTGCITYQHSAWFSGSDDGIFCIECDTTPPIRVREIHNLYLSLKVLTDKNNARYKVFESAAHKIGNLIKGELMELKRKE